MPNASVMIGTQSTRPAGLVSVDGRSYPLQSARVEARAEGGVAATTFTQIYGNPYQEPLEVLYTLPLPAGGAVIGYTVRLGNRVIRGEVQRREAAREEYRKALLEGRTAALLEQDRADAFTQKLGCLPPGESAEVEILVVQSLDFRPGDVQVPAQWEYRFPTVAGVRYEGAPGRVPDAARLDVDRAGGEGTPVRLEAALLIADGSSSAIRPVSPGRQIRCEECEGGVRVVLDDAMRLDRDLVFRWLAVQEDVAVRAVEGKGVAGDDGRYLLVTLTPPAGARQAIARDLTILIDASGSMSGKPIERAKLVAQELLRTLDSGDRFEILAFSERVEALTRRQMEATPKNIEKSLAKLAALQAGGATEMVQAMVEALSPLRPGSQRQVILITDGYIGFESEVIGQVLRRMIPGVRLHAVGIGAAPNRTLTRGVARAGRGVEILVGDDDDARTASRRLLQATVRPVLTDIEVSGTALTALAPRHPQDVLEGSPLILMAEVTAAGGELQIAGRMAGISNAWSHKLSIPGHSHHEPGVSMRSTTAGATTLPLGALYGREAVEDRELLLAAASSSPERSRIEKEIEELGLRHRIASRRTSLIAISEDPTVDPKDPRRRERLAVELPAEVSAEGVGLTTGPMALSMAALPAAMMRSRLPRVLHEMADFARGVRDQADTLDRDAGPVFEEWSASADAAEEETVAPLSAPPPGVCEGRILWVEGQLLIFEFDVPVDGFLLPGDGEKVQIHFDDGNPGQATVLGAESSYPGPHSEGLTVRLAVQLEDWLEWNYSEVWVSWPEAENAGVQFHIWIGK